MKANIGCIPCFIRQGLAAARLSTDDIALQKKILDEIMRRFQGVSLNEAPPDMSYIAYSVVREMTGVADPYAAIRRDTNRRALDMIPAMRETIASSDDPLYTAIKIALTGNIIDLGVPRAFDLERDIAKSLKKYLTVDDTPAFRELLKNCHRLLYVCDNSGEIAFDCLLVEQLKPYCEVIASVKSGPIINDAVMADAEEVGLTKFVRVIETGCDRVGVNWDLSSKEFKDTFESADIILCKGQGNFETLDESPGEIFFLLKIKCPEVAYRLGAPEGSTIFKRSQATA